VDQHKSVKVLSEVIGASAVVVMGAVAVAVASEQAGNGHRQVGSRGDGYYHDAAHGTGHVRGHRGDDCKHTRGIPLTPARGNS
jgi:hypothetical protein